MESKVPKATHSSNWKRHKDEWEAALPPARKWRAERTHNKFPRATRQKKRDRRVRGDLDLQHLALSIYITSLHKAAMDHSSQLVLALWRKAMGCHKVQAFHILAENSSALSLSHSKLMLAFEDNILEISLSLSSSWEAIFEYVAARLATAWGIKIHLSCGTTSVHFSVNNNFKSLCFGFISADLCSLKPQASVAYIAFEWFQSNAIVSCLWGYFSAVGFY